MKTHHLVAKPIAAMIEDVNPCFHLRIAMSNDPSTIIQAARNYAYGSSLSALSVVTIEKESLTMYSYPVWAVFHS
jgi:hypothetical protein